jgi:hypothetical protein
MANPWDHNDRFAAIANLSAAIEHLRRVPCARSDHLDMQPICGALEQAEEALRKALLVADNLGR